MQQNFGDPTDSGAAQIVVGADVDIASQTSPPASDFIVVGLGASAGGLEALEHFFLHLPADTGMAFVVITHLDPTHTSQLSEILQRATSLPVFEAQDQQPVLPNCVYVIPPNRDLLIFHDILQLSVPNRTRGLHLPIDLFLCSLADDRGASAVGILLSGTGSDGTLGLRALLAAGGMSLVQDPDSARYSAMPANAIRAGYANYILPPEAMPNALIQHSRNGKEPRGNKPGSPPLVFDMGAMNRIFMLLRTCTGHDFSLYKKSTISRRIERRIVQHDIHTLDAYARYLKENPAELQLLFKDLLINVTSFFRDPEVWESFRQEVLPILFADKPDDYAIRIWVAGCATGEEAYTIAMLLREYMDDNRLGHKIQLYSTDLDDEAISIARAAVYPPSIADDVSSERLRRFFIKEEGGYRVKKDIREMVVFAIQSVIKDPPFTRLDLLSCRNLLIYLEPTIQNRLIPAFHYALKPGGVLMLSPSESIGNHTELFAPINRKWKFYRAQITESGRVLTMSRGSGLPWNNVEHLPAPFESLSKPVDTGLSGIARMASSFLLQAYAPPSVVTDKDGSILYIHGDTSKYLRLPPGQATLNLVEMARNGLQQELRAALHEMRTLGGATFRRDAQVKLDDTSQGISFALRLLPGIEAEKKLLLVSFVDSIVAAAPETTPRRKRPPNNGELQRIAELERELAYTKECLQASIEEQQAAHEEFKSSNEEMQSTNEELQSTNEELETSKEELQSVNEELITVNAELQAKIEQLAGMQNDMKNLFDNISVGAIFLDEYMHIRRFTREAVRIYRLASADVGRPLNDIKSNLEHEDLLTDAQAVLDSLVPCERMLRLAGSDIWFLARIQPYRTLDNVIEGVVLTFTDITARIVAESAGRAAQQLADGIVETIREPLLVLGADLRVLSASKSFYRIFQMTPLNVVGLPVFELGDHHWDNPALRHLLEITLPGMKTSEGYVLEHDFPLIGHRKLLVNASCINDGTGALQLVLLAMEEAK